MAPCTSTSRTVDRSPFTRTIPRFFFCSSAHGGGASARRSVRSGVPHVQQRVGLGGGEKGEEWRWARKRRAQAEGTRGREGEKKGKRKTRRGGWSQGVGWIQVRCEGRAWWTEEGSGKERELDVVVKGLYYYGQGEEARCEGRDVM